MFDIWSTQKEREDEVKKDDIIIITAAAAAAAFLFNLTLYDQYHLLATCIKQCMLCSIFQVWSEHSREIWLDVLTCNTGYDASLEVLYSYFFQCCYCLLWALVRKLPSVVNVLIY